MLSCWPVRDPRPISGRPEPLTPLITGQRVIDVPFPIARGVAATIPGGFGTGEKWANADVVVYVGCGERLGRVAYSRSGSKAAER
jgi:V/A-type H+-transporting ATPase subunit A